MILRAPISSPLAACAGLVLLLSGASAQTKDDQPAPGAAKQAVAEREKQRDLRGPAINDAALSSLTPQARESSGFVDVEEKGPSPFGMEAAKPDRAAPARPLTEEEKIRNVLRNMRVAGRAGSPGNYRVLLGTIPLTAGGEVPRLFANQAETLRVQSITEREIVLEFADNDESAPARTINLSYDLSPQADPLLAGEVFLKLVPLDGEGTVKLAPASSASAEALLQEVRDQDLQSLVDRPIELFDAPAVLESNAEDKP